MKLAISRGKVITVGIMAVNIRNNMQKNNIAALLYTLEASFPAEEEEEVEEEKKYEEEEQKGTKV